jgi:hypothetical protein
MSRVKSLRLNIGDEVRVMRITTVATRGRVRKAEYLELTVPIIGWVVGAVRRQEGMIEGSGKQVYDAWGDYDYDARHLVVTNTLLLYKVARSMRGEPIEAGFEDIQKLYSWVPDVLPMVGGKGGSMWTDDDRAAFRKAAKFFPRDARGRWAKVGGGE